MDVAKGHLADENSVDMLYSTTYNKLVDFWLLQNTKWSLDINPSFLWASDGVFNIGLAHHHLYFLVFHYPAWQLVQLLKNLGQRSW